MKDYQLKPDEVVLYKGAVDYSEQDGNTQLVFTNLNVVLITKSKKIFEEEKVEIEEFSLSKIKFFNDVPQVKREKLTVEIYFTDGEVEFSFEKQSELHKFLTAALKLLTGKSSAERTAAKVKNAIALVNDTLGIDVVKETGSSIKEGIPGKTFTALAKIFKKK